MSNPDYRDDWTSFSRKQDIWPFQRCNDVFDKSAVRLSTSEDWNVETLLTPPEKTAGEASDFSPEVLISINKKELLKSSGLPANDIGVSVHVMDPGLKRSFSAFSKRLDQLKDESPVTISSDILDSVSISRGLCITLVAHSLKASGNYSLGDRIAEKEFILRAPASISVSFPIKKLDPGSEDWPSEKFASDTAWFIWWGERTSMLDYEAKVEDVMTVYFNEKVYNNLHRLQKKDNAAHNLFWSQISADIFLEVTAVYLSCDDSEEPEDTQNGFRAKFVRSLKKQWERTPGGGKLSLPALIKLFKEDADFLSKVRAVIQQRAKMLKLSEKIPA
jgi:hypothetical protein